MSSADAAGDTDGRACGGEGETEISVVARGLSAARLSEGRGCLGIGDVRRRGRHGLHAEAYAGGYLGHRPRGFIMLVCAFSQGGRGDTNSWCWWQVPRWKAL